jgi:hypothetical protein
MQLTDDERDLLLAGLFELTITTPRTTRGGNGAKLGPRSWGRAQAMFFGAWQREPRRWRGESSCRHYSE